MGKLLQIQGLCKKKLDTGFNTHCIKTGVRVMVEADSMAVCQECVDQVVETICRQGHARV